MTIWDAWDALLRYAEEKRSASGDRCVTEADKQGLEAILAKIPSHPLMQRFVQQKRVSLPITQPWQAQAERLLMAVSIAKFPVKVIPSGDEDTLFALATSAVLLTAKVFLWHSNITEMANAMPLPRHIVSRDILPFPVMYWTTQGAFPSRVMSPDGEVSIHGDRDFVLLVDRGTYVALTSNIATENGQDHYLIRGEIPYGSRYPEDIRPGSVEEQMLKWSAFLNSPFVSSDVQRTERHIRHELIRAGMKNDVGDAHVVKLRSPLNIPTEQTGESYVEWSGRWWVRGHIRAQWHPSTKSHKLMWIAPYIKGPADKPLIQTTYDVVR